MPLRPRRLFAPATQHGTRQRGLALPAIALAIATILPATVAGAGAAGPAPDPVFQAVTTRSSVSAHRPLVANAANNKPDVMGLSVDSSGRTWFAADRDGSASVGIEPAVDDVAAVHLVTLSAATGWWLPNGETGLRWVPVAWTAGAADALIAIQKISTDGLISSPMALTAYADGDAPVATVEPLTVEQGELTLRWSDTDGPGAGIVTRDVRIEEAPSTAKGCGTFKASGGISLGDGDYDRGVLPLGPPPSSGCLRVRLTLTDLVGHTAVAASPPYRVVVPATEAKATSWTGRFNLYQAGTFVTQKTFTWCVAASVQMMVNIVRGRRDRSTTTQARMIEYAQLTDDGPYGEGGGTDLTGWISALRRFGAGKYRAVGANTPAEALRTAAIAMRQTGRPAGILVMEGRHAWILHGFESRTDPRRDSRAWIRAVRVSGPLYPIQQKNGYDQSPNTRLSVKALERWFLPTSVGTLVGKYVVVIPTH